MKRSLTHVCYTYLGVHFSVELLNHSVNVHLKLVARSLKPLFPFLCFPFIFILFIFLVVLTVS